MMMPTFLMFVALLTSCSFSGPPCHSCKQTSCDCSGQDLSGVPAAPSRLITGLDLSSNRLKAVMREDFSAYAGLQVLIMSNNTISTIQKEALDPLRNLVKLDLSSNRLRKLSARWFQKLLSLEHLNLLGNQYRTLGPDSLFQPLKRLKTLQLGGPALQSVRRGDFSGLAALEKLIFDGQNLQTYAAGSLRQIGPMEAVTLCLEGPFSENPPLVEAVLSDVGHPNTTLAFSDTSFVTGAQMSPFEVLKDGGTTRVVFKHVDITLSASLAFLSLLSASDLKMLAFEDTTFFLSGFDGGSYPVFSASPDKKHLEEIVLRNVNVPQFYNFPALLILATQLRALRRVSGHNIMLFALPCEISRNFPNLEYADISGNILSDLALCEIMCHGEGGLWNLQTLNISRNHLQTINSRLFAQLSKLENLDMSGNSFHGMPEVCHWPPRLRFLNLSSTHLGEVTACLPSSLHVLDVSHNALTAFCVRLPSLSDLYISGNKLATLPDGGLFPRLTFLSIQNNSLRAFSAGALGAYRSLRSVAAGADTYTCSCEFVAFATADFTERRFATADELRSYICDSPDGVRGQSVADARLSVFECHAAIALSSLCLGVAAAVLLVAGLCHRYSVPWYIRTAWAWLRAKRKPKLKKGALEYDAFVSYSDMDSGWVEAHLIPELEQSEPRLRLCLHKRDFAPGGWILDNIMDAIEKSYRTVFVLSRNFVRSEWCKYELDYTHFRLFDQNDDAAVLILLEAIDKGAIPRKFSRLRRVMNSRTYLEWPHDDNQIPGFWQSLRAAVQRTNSDG